MKTLPASGQTVHACSHLWLRRALCIALAVLLIGAACSDAQTTKSTKPAPAVAPPRWFNKIPPDESNLVTKGRGESKDQQLAIDKAAMAATEDIVRSIEEQWSALLKSIESEDSSIPTPDLKWGPVTLERTRIKQQKAVRKGKVWTAFVLVSLPRSSLHSHLLERLHQDEQWYSQVKNLKAVQKFESPVPGNSIAR